MYNQLTTFVNIANVREQIVRKKCNSPYFATTDHYNQVWTDYDVFPYTRFFSGIPLSSKPIVAEREAGWMFRKDECYKASKLSNICEEPYPNHCFQSACSTVRPCHPKHDRDELHQIYNKSFNVKFR